MTGHLSGLGKNLDNAVEAYNRTVGSFESRVLVAARRFKELGASTSGEIDPLEGVDRTARPLISAPAGEDEQSPTSDDNR
jgi:DNA recombination protein RmuC